MKEIRLRIFGEAVIEVGDTQVTPTSSHIFALLLLLTLGPKEGWTRRELMEMLFEGVEAKEASHRLRQLLYKLRGMGVEMGEERTGLVRITNPVVRPEEFMSHGGSVPEGLATSHADWILPRYTAPAIGILQGWIEEQRDALAHSIRASLTKELRRSHQAIDWDATSRLGRTLLARDPYNLEAVAMTAEALTSCGLRYEAFAVIDDYLALTELDDDDVREIRRLRARLTKLGSWTGTSPVRGREVLVSGLIQHIRSPDPQEGTLTVVEGAPGIGKTRLAQALADNFVALGTPVLRFDCNSNSRHIPLAPFVEVATRLQQMRGALGASPAFKGVLQALAVPTTDEPWPHNESETLSRRLTIQHALTDLIQSVTSESSIVLLLDDAHLLDEGSLDLVRTLAEGAHTPAFRMILFVRPHSYTLDFLARVPNILLITLPPLTDDACRDILRDIPGTCPRSEAHIQYVLTQSAGNPFYLKLLAKHEYSQPTQPLELQSLAEATYARLDNDARLALEACLLLDSVATLPRLEQISGLTGQHLIAALRQLEKESLLRLENGRMIGPHALLHTALRHAIPTSVRGVLHRRIASALNEECIQNANNSQLALAAIQHWLEISEGGSALALARSCANHAVSLGEPLTAVLLLDSIPRCALAVQDQKLLLEDIINLSDHTRQLHIFLSALRERIALADLLGDNASNTAAFQLRLIAAEHVVGAAYPGPVHRVRAIAIDSGLRIDVRLRAVSLLLTVAFLDFDVALAEKAHCHLLRIPAGTGDRTIDLLRSCASLVYHTSFGSREVAVALVDDLLKRYSAPMLDRDTQMARKYAGFAATRLGLRDIARKVFATELVFCEEKAAFGIAEFAAGVLSDIAISDGDYSEAELYLKRLEHIGKRRRQAQTFIASYFSSAACIAIRNGELDKASELLRSVEQSHASIAAPRQRSISIAIQMRIAAYRGDEAVSKDAFDELRMLFERGCKTGGQDLPAEAVWRGELATNGPQSATRVLRHYLEAQRREFGPVEADLWWETKRDELWSEPQFARLIPAISSSAL